MAKLINPTSENIFNTVMVLLMLIACDTQDEVIPTSPLTSGLYFPPASSDEWATTAPGQLNWNTSELADLLSYLESNNTRAFIILKDGKIVIEEYFGNNILNTSPFGRNTQWYWASAGKTLTATLVGIAQQEGAIDIEHPTSDYLGNGWTSIQAEKEQLVKVKNHLTMTTGLAYDIADLDCTLPACLQYMTEAGQQWYYHNAPYTLLRKVVENATGSDYNEFTNQKIASLIGMQGQWRSQGYNSVYWSTARDMARFGLLMLNHGKWDNTEILSDEAFYREMTNSSQDINPSYGYLWWLNGKNSIIFPSIPTSFNVSLSVNAPMDLFAGMGKNGQFIEVVPSENLVVIRMGDSPDNSLVPIAFHDEMWGKIGLIMNE